MTFAIYFSKKYNVYLKNSEEFLPYMNPQFYFYNYDTSLLEKINMLQAKLNYLIQALSNGSYFDIKSVLFNSLNTINISYIRNDLLFIKYLLESIESTEKTENKKEVLYISSVINNICTKKKAHIFEVLFIIKYIYQLLHNYVDLFDLKNRTKIINVKTRAMENLNDLPATVSPILLSLKGYVSNNLKDYIVDFYIHGSISTKDFTKFSDLDTAIILKDDTLLDIDKFARFLKSNFRSIKYCYQFNLLHHHGHYILTERDLQYYNQAVLPAEVFRYSTPLFGNEEIRFNVRDSTFEHFSLVWNVIQYFRRSYVLHFKNINNMYKFRFFVATILFLPVIFLETKGIYVYKKYSFDLAKRYFSTEEWEAVEIASEFWRNWDYKPPFLVRLSSIISLRLMHNYKIFDSFLANYPSKLPSSIQKTISREKFFEKSIIFSEAIADDLYHSFIKLWRWNR
ncbi:nucleotidyltransferase domain-containing protein [Pyrococcus horikoshii]|nr:nucleotidyltransferase domain-containing protein [Pyrococcus horikoshii]HII60991.1 hypothetical protein [Pyrococcus horikoshii]